MERDPNILPGVPFLSPFSPPFRVWQEQTDHSSVLTLEPRELPFSFLLSPLFPLLFFFPLNNAGKGAAGQRNMGLWGGRDSNPFFLSLFSFPPPLFFFLSREEQGPAHFSDFSTTSFFFPFPPPPFPFFLFFSEKIKGKQRDSLSEQVPPSFLFFPPLFFFSSSGRKKGVSAGVVNWRAGSSLPEPADGGYPVFFFFFFFFLIWGVGRPGTVNKSAGPRWFSIPPLFSLFLFFFFFFPPLSKDFQQLRPG